MSLIEEALRRAQGERRPQEPKRLPVQPPSPTTPPSSAAEPSRTHVWIRFALTGAGIGIFATGLIAGILWIPRLMVATAPTLSQIPAGPPAPAKPHRATADSSSTPARGTRGSTHEPARITLESSPTSAVPVPPAPAVTVPPEEVVVVPQKPAARHRVAPVPMQPELELNGIVEGIGEPFVIINGRLVRLGETVEGATLLEVKKDTVRLRWLDQELVLRTTR